MDHFLNPALIGQNVRFLREHLFHLTQVQAAQRCQVSRATLRRIEDGVQAPSLQFIYRFTRLDPRYLFAIEYLANRDLQAQPIFALKRAGAYFRFLDSSSDEFALRWYEKVSADLRLFSLLREKT